MERLTLLLGAVLSFLCLVVPLSTASAAITAEGSVGEYAMSFPPTFFNSDPNGWTSSTNGYIGNDSYGSVTVSNNSDLYSHSGNVGYDFDSTGVVTISGAGSSWTSDYIGLGYFGNGTLNISDGGAVMVSHTTELARYTSFAQGAINFNNGTLTTRELFASPSQLTGTGMIYTRGLISDIDLVFDSTHGLSQTFTPSGSNVVINLNMNDTTNTGELGAGYKGNGSLLIQDGVKVISNEGYIGYFGGSTGVVSVDGAGSEWTTMGHLHCVSSGSGSLNITGGGAVTITNEIDLGGGGRGILAIDVGFGSLLKVNINGIINNDSIIRILAGAGATAGQVYNPISYGELRDLGGTCQFVGGNPFGSLGITVSPVVEGTSGNAVTINNLSTEQRMLFYDSGEGKTGWTLGASFLYKDTGALSLTATTINDDELDFLKALLPSGQSVLGGWDFSDINGYTTGDPVYLSFDIGLNYSRDDLQVWRCNGSQWSKILMSDLTCNGGYASFTVTSFSGYAVTGLAVPEPSTLILLDISAISMLAYVWRRRMRTV